MGKHSKNESPKQKADDFDRRYRESQDRAQQHDRSALGQYNRRSDGK